MYELNDTIAAVSSPTSDKRVIFRITGPETIEKVSQIFSPSISADKAFVVPGRVTIDAELEIDAKLYLFLAPHSYTGDDIAEIHIYTNLSVSRFLMKSLLAKGLRPAGPGEFTARAYLNGKIDLAQAEAVNEIIIGSNNFQIAAAEKLLAGRLGDTTAKVRDRLMDCLSLIEAGLDFSGEDIEFITRPQALERLAEIKVQLQQLLDGSISYESVIDLPSVGIAGAPNAGKSSLLNTLLGKERSIVSGQPKTTRDVLTGLLKLANCQCVLFDCAGLTFEMNNILDELAQAAAIESLKNSSVVVFCVDISKADWARDVAIRKLIGPEILIAVATKSDLLSEDMLTEKLAELGELFGADFIATSAAAGDGIELLLKTIDNKIIAKTTGSAKPQTQYAIRDTQYEIALTARHRQAVTEAIENISEAAGELKAGNDDVVAMLLRGAYQAVSNIEAVHVDEQVLDNIFKRFCIGK
ncbi:MAG: tRNA modification GTPase [Planctomycetota bacterium]|jgi:tRNA modification GTPase